MITRVSDAAVPNPGDFFGVLVGDGKFAESAVVQNEADYQHH
jgi:hypothetical protein